MKLYITNDNSTLEDYQTYSPLLGNNVRELDEDLVGDSECTEIFAPNIIDFIPIQFLLTTLQNYVKKLRKSGKITLGGVDINLLGLMIARREVSTIQANQLLYGGVVAHECKSGLASVNDISGLLEELGLKVMKKSITGINYLVEAVRL